MDNNVQVIDEGDLDDSFKNCAVNEGIIQDSADATESELIDFSLKAIAHEQKLDKDINVILQLKQQGVAKPDWDDLASESAVTKTLWQQWPRLEVHSNVLFRKFEMLDGRAPILQIVMPHKMRRDFFVQVHSGVGGGDMGRKRTERQIQLKAYWPGWTVDTRRYMKMCNFKPLTVPSWRGVGNSFN